MINVEGIQVLNTYITREPDLFGLILLLLVGIIIGTIGVLFILGQEKISGASFIIVGLVFVLLCVYGFTHRISVIHYDVLISDSVPFTKVHDKYDIQGKDGDIYHLTLREEPEEDKTND